MLSLNFQQLFPVDPAHVKGQPVLVLTQECYHSSFQEQGWARGSHSASASGWVYWQKSGLSPQPTSVAPLFWGRAAACSITADRIDVASKLPHCLEPGALPGGYTVSQVQGFLKLQESLCPGQLPTQTLPKLPNIPPFPPCTEGVQTQIENHWTSCQRRLNSMTPKLPSGLIRLG